jgi:hypothetical protein
MALTQNKEIAFACNAFEKKSFIGKKANLQPVAKGRFTGINFELL